MDLQLAGRRCVVTGGTKGIGRAVVEGLVAEGAHVAFCARDAGEVAAANAAIGAAGGTVFGSVCDVGDGDALTAWVAAAAGQLGGIDVVVSNVSALAIPDTDENWEASLRVDLMGTVRLYKAAMPFLEASDAASAVTVSSVSGREADFASGPYGTVKSALIGYTGGLALQNAGKNIRFNTVSPGNTYHEGGVWSQIKNGNRELYDMALGLNPTGRMGTPQEMAAAVVFLASPVSSFTTGTNLVVDGALTRGIQF
ncbi:SDR family NAD(P)-dependent oxidoreductase [Kineosporia sp. A_224]|uniref:SDR family NAD(P)-dependent oxidoreductase n=1 Tax=Kineosporia sp. A_224 TaxID=1962180 RepID=UPI000B4C0C29|nr:SDR family oxidoreductase [Kineosporia sp. A_224]